MHINEAAKILGLSGELTLDIIKKAYKRMAMQYHPDRNPAGLEMMKVINAAYEALKDHEGDTVFKSDDVDFEYPSKLASAINAIIDLEGLELEICGSWLWVGGNTKEHKDTLKTNGFKWASKKEQWYFRPEDYKSSNRGKFSMDQIREKHGSTKPVRKEKRKLKAA